MRIIKDVIMDRVQTRTIGIIVFRNMLVLCVGNICRSPMAEGLLKAAVAKIPNEISVSSAGIAAVVGSPAHEEAQSLMLKQGIDISDHRARQLDDDIISSADIVWVMEEKQKRYIGFQYPHSRGKVFLLGQCDGFEIPDPYHQEISYQHAFELIQKGMSGWIKKI